MNVTLDLDKLIGNQLTPSQFVFCYMLEQEQHSLLNSILTETDYMGVKEDIDYLSNNGWIISNNSISIYDLKSYTVSPKYIKEFGTKTDLFDDLLEVYPDFVIRQGKHKDFLKTNLVKARLRYKKITNNNSELHKEILACLKYELKMREQEQSLGFMKKILSWLESEEWKSYIGYINETPKQAIEIYGTELL